MEVLGWGWDLIFQNVQSDITGVFDVFWIRARAVVARVAPGGKSCACPGRSHASKCLLRRQTESQRDSVHPRRLAREWRFWVGVGISDLIFQNVKK